MFNRFFHCFATLLCAVFLTVHVSAQPQPSLDGAELTYRERILALDPMDLEGVDPKVAWILDDYYKASFGGEHNWEQVESLRFEGVLRLPEGSVSFVAFKKKPDYCKVVLFVGNGARIVMSYDGRDAWQLNSMESSEPVAMPSLEALNFIRDAPTAGHLLYPALPGKKIELLTARRQVEGHACLDLMVTLPNGQHVTYAIDRTDFVERQQIITNSVSGALEVTTHNHSEVVSGVTLAMQSTMTVDGVFKHEIKMRRVEVNQGLMPWMFERPSGLYVPGKLPDGVSELSAGPSVSSTLDSALGGVAPAMSFGEGRERSAFAPSSFPDLDEATKQSMLEGIDELN